MSSDLEAVIPWGISHHLSTIRHHKFTKYIPSVDLEGGDVKKKNVVSVAISQWLFWVHILAWISNRGTESGWTSKDSLSH